MKKILFISIITILIIQFTQNTGGLPSDSLDYIITETGFFDSLDPLDADKTQNLPVARMLFSTPIEIDKDGRLSSRVLSSFFYNEKSKQLIFTLKKGPLFSDGSPIRCKDIVLAITRMLYFRPDFPIIKHILGKDNWLKNKFPLQHLPEGITFDENQIKISFNKDVPNSLFRLSLELFSIVRYEEIDLKSGKLNSKNFATSGPYLIAKKEPKFIIFSRREEPNIRYKTITFKYKKISEIKEKDFTPNTIISGNEADLISSNKKLLFYSSNLQWMPSSRFATIRLNTHRSPFKNKLCRLFFAEQLRSVIKKFYSDITIEGSLFTNLIPGYINHEALRSELYNLSTTDEKKCLKEIRDSSIKLAESENTTLKLGLDLIILTLKHINVKNVSVKSNLNNSQITDEFASGNLSIVAGSSGFWALDPVGDVEMYFTKNLHKTLKYVWEDKDLYSLIEKIDPKMTKLSLEKINKHMFRESRLGIFMHFRRFYATHKDLKIDKILASTSISPPWLLSLSKKNETF